MISHATPRATTAYSHRFPKITYRSLGATGLLVSPAGFGGYRVHITVDEQQQALRDALQKGINLIDTSSNYGDGGSEELIGAVLKGLFDEQKIKRDEVVVVTKAGYIQGQNLKNVRHRAGQGEPFAEVVNIDQNLQHCIHPRFLDDQLGRSLRRLQLKQVDFFLLHNPEYYFYEAQAAGLDRDRAREEFYRRIRQAFVYLEQEADKGRIRFYGVSANSLPLSADDSHFVDIRRLWVIAESLRPDHRFRMVQFPMNLLEPQAAINHTLDGNQTLLQFAREKNFAVLINRPLNAFKNNQLLRLVTVRLNDGFDSAMLENAFHQVEALEETFVRSILNQLRVEAAIQQQLIGIFATGSYLSQHYRILANYWSWMEQHARFISEQVSYAIQKANEAPDNPPRVIEWLDAYVREFNNLLDQLTRYYGRKAEDETGALLKNLYPAGNIPAQLSRVALDALWRTEGVSAVLVGMRRPDYVREIVSYLEDGTGLAIPSWAKISGVFNKMVPSISKDKSGQNV